MTLDELSVVHHVEWVGGTARTAAVFLASLNWCDTQPLCRGNLGIPRKDMPQIRAHAIKAFVLYAEGSGVSVRNTSRRVRDLRATQREINGTVVEDLAREGLYALLRERPMLASEDGYILDGHHRWAALLTVDPEQEVDLLEVQAPVREVLALAHAFPGTEYSMRVSRWNGYRSAVGMSLRSQTIRLAASLPPGAERRSLLAVLRESRSDSKWQDFLDVFRPSDAVYERKYEEELAITSDFFKEMSRFRRHPEVQKLIHAFREWEDAGSVGEWHPVQEVRHIADEVISLARKYLHKFDPAVLREVEHGRGEVPDRILTFSKAVQRTADDFARGHSSIPLFLKLIGVPVQAFDP